MQIDHYGFEATSQWFCRRELEPHLIRKVGDNVYVCFHKADPRPVHRIRKLGNGDIEVMWAYGAWAQAAGLAYVPINETLEV